MFSSYHVSTLDTADFNSPPTIFILVATGPMNDPSSISASRAFSSTLSITSAEKFAALVHTPLTFEAVPLAKSTISSARF